MDIWDGYPAERSQIIDSIRQNNINNVVILTGDVHAAFAFDVVDKPVNVTFQNLPIVGEAPFYSPTANYNAASGAGSVAVEFVTPSVTSANFDENLDLATAQTFQIQINKPIEPIPGLINLGNPNPHMKYTDLIRHGYYVLDIKADSVQANWYYSPILEINQNETFDAAYYTKNGENHLQKADVASAPKTTQDTPAPNDPLNTTDISDLSKTDKFAILGVYPNPFEQLNTLHYSLSASAQVSIGLYDAKGALVRNLLNQRMQPGIFSLQLNANDLANGTYFYKIQVDNKQYATKVLIAK